MTQFLKVFPHYSIKGIDNKTKLILTILLGAWGVVSIFSIYSGTTYLIKMYDSGIAPQVGMLITRFLLTGIFFGVFYFKYNQGIKKVDDKSMKIGFIFYALSLCAYFGVVLGGILTCLANIPMKKLKNVISFNKK